MPIPLCVLSQRPHGAEYARFALNQLITDINPWPLTGAVQCSSPTISTPLHYPPLSGWFTTADCDCRIATAPLLSFDCNATQQLDDDQQKPMTGSFVRSPPSQLPFHPSVSVWVVLNKTYGRLPVCKYRKFTNSLLRYNFVIFSHSPQNYHSYTRALSSDYSIHFTYLLWLVTCPLLHRRSLECYADKLLVLATTSVVDYFVHNRKKRARPFVWQNHQNKQ